MRSAVYSLFTTLLLLVPISAVPLMAIFGIPQFTPVVASPLDELMEDDQEVLPRRKPRQIAKTQRTDETENDLSLEETPNWDGVSPERPRPMRKSKGPSGASPESPSPDEADTELAMIDRPKSKPRRTAELPDSSADGSIQKAGHETVQDRSHAEVPEVSPPGIQDLFSKDGSQGDDKVPGYRRPRAASPGSGAGASDQNTNRNKRASPPVEPLTWTKAVQRLNELGIRNFRLEPGDRPGEYSFACSYTPSNSPHVTRRFEAEADDPLKAVAKVLAQVEDAAQQKVLAAPRRLTDFAERRGPE